MRTHVILGGVSKPRRAYVWQDNYNPWVRANPQKIEIVEEGGPPR
jgi:hypothetical protein